VKPCERWADDRGLAARLDESDAVAEWLAAIGREHILRGSVSSGLACTGIAAAVLSRQSRRLTSQAIERNLQAAARRIDAAVDPAPDPSPARSGRPAVLHVLSEALPAGGHTAMAVRWMRSDVARSHAIALLDQQVPVAEELCHAVAEAGGRIYEPPRAATLAGRATWLRTLARRDFDFVVLHVDVSDVVAGTALGVDGGPPVLLVNHAAHAFWTGATTVDAVVNCRGSQLEDEWTREHRGARQSLCVPIPLVGDAPVLDRAAVRRELGLPADAVVLLTAGAYYKFLPVEGQDFLAACRTVLREADDVVVLAAGFHGDERWTRTSAESGHRLRTLGVVSRDGMARLRAAADVYVEGFPFGTTTALLEAGLCGLPAVLAPATSPPPYGTDGLATDSCLVRPASPDRYVASVLELVRSPTARARVGARLREAVASTHSGEGWRRHVDDCFHAVGATHRVSVPRACPPTPEPLHLPWARVVERTSSAYDERLELALIDCWSRGVHPRLEREFVARLADGRRLARARSAPLGVVAGLAAAVSAGLPPGVGRVLLKSASYVRRHGPLRAPYRLLQRVRRAGPARGDSYDDYKAAARAAAARPGE
jgi:hypothetical protein